MDGDAAAEIERLRKRVAELEAENKVLKDELALAKGGEGGGGEGGGGEGAGAGVSTPAGKLALAKNLDDKINN